MTDYLIRPKRRGGHEISRSVNGSFGNEFIDGNLGWYSKVDGNGFYLAENVDVDDAEPTDFDLTGPDDEGHLTAVFVQSRYDSRKAEVTEEAEE